MVYFYSNGSLLTNATKFVQQNSENRRFDGNYGILVEWSEVRRQGSREVSHFFKNMIIIFL